MMILVPAAVLLAMILGLLAWLLLGRAAASGGPQGMTREEAARQAAQHLRRAVALFEARTDAAWLAKANHHLIQAMKLGHNDGEAAERLAINLEKHGQARHAMEVCELVLNPGYRLRKGASLSKKDFAGRLARYREKHGSPRADMPLFTPEEAVGILRASRT